MATTKETGVVTSQFETDAENPFDQNVTPEKKGTFEDQRDMFRMGKVQEMRVCAIRTRVVSGEDALLTVLASEISASFPSSAFL
jgi:hypothetical protein